MQRWWTDARGGMRDYPGAIGRAWQPWVERSRALQPLFAIFGLLLLVAGLLMGLKQGRDLILAAVGTDDNDTTLWNRVLFIVLAQCLYILTAWFCSRLVIENALSASHKLGTRGILFVWRWLPRVAASLAAAPIILVILLSPENSGRSGVTVLAASLTVIAVVLARRTLHIGDGLFAVEHSRIVISALAGAGIVLAVALHSSPVVLARTISAPGLALIAVASMMAGVTAVYTLTSYRRRGGAGGTAPEIGDRRYLPVLAAMVAVVSLWGALDIAGNYPVGGGPTGVSADKAHPVRANALSDRPAIMLAGDTLQARLAQWRASLPTRQIDNEEQPIIIVATSGGASRAAHWTARVLSELENVDGFRDHLFAISSVSGGSLGTAAYLASAAETPAVRGSDAVWQRIRGVTGDDHLAPVIGAMLFGDSLARFVPLRPVGRDTALELAFATSWDSRCPAAANCKPRGFDQPFLSLWKQPNWVPLWFANGTRVEDGRRIITAPVVIDDAEFPDALDFHRLTGFDVPIRTAITNTARFPLVSPTGQLQDRAGHNRGGIIDGGYFENGGVETASDIINAINSLPNPDKQRYKFVLIAIDNEGADRPDRDWGTAHLTSQGQKELYRPQPALPVGQMLDPVLGLYNTRSARGTGTRVRTARELPALKNGVLIEIPLCPFDGKQIGLNWTLSKAERRSIETAFSASPKPKCAGDWQKAKRQLHACLTGGALCGTPGTGVTTPAGERQIKARRAGAPAPPIPSPSQTPAA